MRNLLLCLDIRTTNRMGEPMCIDQTLIKTNIVGVCCRGEGLMCSPVKGGGKASHYK